MTKVSLSHVGKDYLPDAMDNIYHTQRGFCQMQQSNLISIDHLASFYYASGGDKSPSISPVPMSNLYLLYVYVESGGELYVDNVDYEWEILPNVGSEVTQGNADAGCVTAHHAPRLPNLASPNISLDNTGNANYHAFFFLSGVDIRNPIIDTYKTAFNASVSRTFTTVPGALVIDFVGGPMTGTPSEGTAVVQNSKNFASYIFATGTTQSKNWTGCGSYSCYAGLVIRPDVKVLVPYMGML